MKDSSFDIVSEYDNQELTNALDQTKREMSTRYDFKGTDSSIEREGEELIILADSDYKVEAVLDILKNKMISRGLSLKVLDLSQNAEDAAGGTKRKKVKLKKGLDQEKSKKITKLIRDNLPKIKAIIQGEEVRVSSAKKRPAKKDQGIGYRNPDHDFL